MAIKFTFTLNDVDAENLFHWIRSEQGQMDMEILREMSNDKWNVREEYIEWYKKHKFYIGRVMERMLANQEKVEDSEEFNC